MLPRLRPLLIGLLALSCLASGYLLGVRSAPVVAPPAALVGGLSPDDQQAFGVVWETLAQIEREYYQRDALDRHKLAEGAARGLVDALGDPYTKLLDAQRAEQAQADLRGRFDGVGATLDLRDNQVRVIAPLHGSPAELAGVHAGDVIVAIDDASTEGMALSDIVRRVRGPAGTSVQLSVRRAGASDPLVMAITRAEIRVPSVEGRLIEGSPSLGYVRISTFAEPTAQQVLEQLDAVLEGGARGIVLDVRGNPGGYLSSAVDVTSVFLRDGVVLYQQRGPADGGERKTYRANGSARAPDVPLVVLVDGGSASASEIVAAALRDNQRAVLVGQKTFGKGTIQEQHVLSDASQLRVTVAQWLTPTGRAIKGQGLLPDVEVAPVDGRDALLEAAVEVLDRTLAAGGGHG